MGEHKHNPMAMMHNTMRPMQIDTKELIQKTCESCGCEFFDKVARLFLLPKIAVSNRTGDDIRVDAPVFICHKCGHEYGKEVVRVVS